MPKCVCAGAMLQCSFGVAPSTLNVLPKNKFIEGIPVANIMDYIPVVNILPFAMCTAPTNPAVIAATAAALGTPTPAPCVPKTMSSWVAGDPKVLLANFPILTDSSKLMCTWLGNISITQAGQAIVDA